MLRVQEYLLSGKTLTDLSTEFGIKVTYHPIEPICILNYDQLESVKSDPLVRECRSLTLELDSWNIVARSFFRFFNWGEMVDEMKDFVWEDCWAQSKEDGSLITLFYYNGWKIQTKGSFGEGECGFSGKSWQELFFEIIPVDLINVFCVPGYSYVFEFCSLHNKIVRTYRNNSIYLLTTYHNDGTELLQDFSDMKAKDLKCLRPETYKFSNINEVVRFLEEKGKEDATFEGVVLCDKNLQRWKVKNPLYLSLHRLRGEGDNLYNPKYLIPFVLAGEEDELTLYFPECLDKLSEYKNIINKEKNNLLDLWDKVKDIENQKEFALATVPNTKFSSILFQAKKSGKDPMEIWKNSEDLIYKLIFKKC